MGIIHSMNGIYHFFSSFSVQIVPLIIVAFIGLIQFIQLLTQSYNHMSLLLSNPLSDISSPFQLRNMRNRLLPPRALLLLTQLHRNHLMKTGLYLPLPILQPPTLPQLALPAMTALKFLIATPKRAIFGQTPHPQIRNQTIGHQILLLAEDSGITGETSWRMYAVLAEGMSALVQAGGVFEDLVADHANQVFQQSIVLKGELILHQYHQSHPQMPQIQIFYQQTFLYHMPYPNPPPNRKLQLSGQLPYLSMLSTGQRPQSYRMQSQHKSMYLFDVLLDPDEQQSLLQLSAPLLTQLLLRCGRYFYRHIDRIKPTCIFLANYRTLMELRSRKSSDGLSANLCLHFALLLSDYLVRQGNESQARTILRETEQYEEVQGSDPLLLAACASNLTALCLRNGKVYKALASGLRGVSLLESHLEQLRTAKKRERIIEDGVVFVNLLQLTQRALQRIVKINHKAFFRTLLKIVNRLGYSFANKYLGCDSILTRKFVLAEETILLPVFQPDDDSVVLPEHTIFQAKIARELENICNILKDLNLQPEVYYIKEYLVPSQPKDDVVAPSEPPPLPPPAPVPVPAAEPRNVSHSQNIIIDEWQTSISVLREVSLSIDRNYEFLGHLQFAFTKGKRSHTALISEDRLIKILNVLNIHDVLPYECELKRLTSIEFFRRLLVNYLEVSNEGELVVLPRAKSLLDVFQIRFCGELSLIFVNHIHFRKFRVGICPSSTSDSMYLELDFRNKQIQRYFHLQEMVQPPILDLYNQYFPNSQTSMTYQYTRIKSITIVEPRTFKEKLMGILREFELFLVEEEENKLSEISTVINFSETYHYYQYTEFREGFGQFFKLKYRSNANHIEVDLMNNFKTHTPQGESYAKGSTMYSPQEFTKDFGVNLKAIRKQLPAFSHLIAQKYFLKIFESPIDEQHQDLYEQNAIAQHPFTSKFYRRKFIQFEDYLLPITIQVVSLNNERPIGIRVSAYEPIKCIQSGLFIHIQPDYWQKPMEKKQAEPLPEEGESLSKSARLAEDYNFKKSYFLTKWMEQEGFSLIFSKLVITNRTLQLSGISSKFCRLDELLLPPKNP